MIAGVRHKAVQRFMRSELFATNDDRLEQIVIRERSERFEKYRPSLFPLCE